MRIMHGKNVRQTERQTRHLLSDVLSVQRNHATEHCVGDKGLVVHELVRRERGDGVQEQVGGSLEVADCHAVGSLIHLQSVASVPVPAFVNQTVNGQERGKLFHTVCLMLG